MCIRDRGINRYRRGAVLTACLVVIVPLALMGTILFGNWTLDRAVPLLALPFFALVLLAGVSVVAAFRRLDFEGALWRCVLASLLLTIAVYPFAIESLRSLKLSPRLAESVKAAGCADPAVVTLGYREPSLVFLTGTKLAMAEMCIRDSKMADHRRHRSTHWERILNIMTSRKIWVGRILLAAGLFGVAGAAVAADNKVVLYTAHKSSIVQKMIPLFEAETGIKAEVVQLGSGDVFRRARAEAAAPKADVIWSVTGSLLGENADLLAPYAPKDQGAIDERFVSSPAWTPYTTCLLYTSRCV